MSTDMTLPEDTEGMIGGGGMNPFARRDTTASMAIQAMSALVDKRIMTARAFPRSVSRFKKNAEGLIREDIETARSAEYAKPIGGGTVKGTSVRMAEVLLLCWPNLEVEVEEPVIGDKFVSCRASAWDLETNTRQTAVAMQSILDKHGNRYKPSVIETNALACASKARRNVILQAIPRAFVNDLMQVARSVRDKNAPPLEEQRESMIQYFARTYRVTLEQILAVLSVEGVDDIRVEQMEDLRAIAEGLKAGEGKVEDYFPAAASSKAEGVKEKLRNRAEAAKKPNGDAAKGGNLPGMDGAKTQLPD